MKVFVAATLPDSLQSSPSPYCRDSDAKKDRGLAAPGLGEKPG